MSMHFQIMDELTSISEFDPNYSKQKLDEVKDGYRKRIGKLQTKEDYLDLFRDFPLVQSVIKVLFSYQMQIDEFENGSNPFYGTTTELKKHPKKIETVLKQFRGALEVSQKLSDAETVYRLERTINLFETFLDSPSELLSNLHFFEIIDKVMEEKQHQLMPLILHYNPFNDPLLDKWENCSYYLEMLKFFDGFDVSHELLAKSTFIKLHKIFEFDNPTIYEQINNPSDPIKSIFEKMGRSEQMIDFKRLKNIKPKTFYKGIALFDYSKETDFLFHRQVEYAFQNAMKDAMIHVKINNVAIDLQTKIGIEEAMQAYKPRIYRQLFDF